MSSMSANARICPVCGSPNSAISLFCAECGSSLNAPESGTTGTYERKPAPSDSQTTTAFQPLASGKHREPVSTVTPMPVRSPAQTGTWATPAVSQPLGPVVATPNISVENRPESMRGFFLGVVACVLILAVFLLWAWAAVLDDSTRSSISDLFGLLN